MTGVLGTLLLKLIFCPLQDCILMLNNSRIMDCLSTENGTLCLVALIVTISGGGWVKFLVVSQINFLLYPLYDNKLRSLCQLIVLSLVHCLDLLERSLNTGTAGSDSQDSSQTMSSFQRHGKQ